MRRTGSEGGAHLTLEPIGFLGPLSLHVFRQYGVFVQLCPVVQVTGQGLGLLSMLDVYHIHGEVKVGLTLLKAFLVFNLECYQQGHYLKSAFAEVIYNTGKKPGLS